MPAGPPLPSPLSWRLALLQGPAAGHCPPLPARVGDQGGLARAPLVAGSAGLPGAAPLARLQRRCPAPMLPAVPGPPLRPPPFQTDQPVLPAVLGASLCPSPSQTHLDAMTMVKMNWCAQQGCGGLGRAGRGEADLGLARGGVHMPAQRGALPWRRVRALRALRPPHA